MNFEKYPWLKDLESESAQSAILEARSNYLLYGVATFPDFITKEALDSAVKDVITKSPHAFQTDTTHNVYLSSPDSSYDPTHVRNRMLPTQVSSVAFDELDSFGTIATLYSLDALSKLVGAVTGQTPCYQSCDPLGCCSINVFRQWQGHAWHFDESEFSTTLMLQKPQSGGIFQFTPRLRSNQQDLAVDSVECAMATGENVRDLVFEDGTLSIFAGRYSLHRVTPIVGETERLVAVFAFSSQSGYMNSAQVQEMFWGRSNQTPLSFSDTVDNSR